MVTETPVQYESRGKHFDSKADAERHEALSEARENLELAQRKFQHLLAKSAVTADGQQFEFGVFCDYFHVVRPYSSKPYLRQFCYLCWAWAVRDSDEPGVIEIREEKSDDKPSPWIPIKDLYRSRQMAETALLAAQREWLNQTACEIEEFAAKVKPTINRTAAKQIG